MPWKIGAATTGEADEQVQQWRSRLLTGKQRTNHHWCHPWSWVNYWQAAARTGSWSNPSTESLQFNLSRFVRVFCSRTSLIFLDDLQWIDSATLKLIELMLLDEQTQYLFLIGAIRDNEVHPTHPLVLTLRDHENRGSASEDNPDTNIGTVESIDCRDARLQYWHRSFPSSWCCVKRRAIPSLSVNFWECCIAKICWHLMRNSWAGSGTLPRLKSKISLIMWWSCCCSSWRNCQKKHSNFSV